MEKIPPLRDLTFPNAPPVREKLLPLHSVGEESKDVPDEAWLSPIMSDIRRMPMHTALGMSAAILEHVVVGDTITDEFVLALALSKWARGVPVKGGKVGDNDTQGKA